MQPNGQHCGVHDLQAVLVVEPAMDYYGLLKVLGSVLIHTPTTSIYVTIQHSKNHLIFLYVMPLNKVASLVVTLD